MTALRDFNLKFEECSGIGALDDVVSAVELMREQGLVLVELNDGVNQVVSDARAFLTERSFDFVSRGVLTPAQLASPAQHLQIWGGPCARADTLASAATFGANRRRDNAWDLTVHLVTHLLRPEDEPLDLAVRAWLALIGARRWRTVRSGPSRTCRAPGAQTVGYQRTHAKVS